MCRKNVSASMVGVAVPAALVPPLATVGVGVRLGSGTIAFAAVLLYVTNLVVIATASGMVFLLLGFARSAGSVGLHSLLRQGLRGFSLRSRPSPRY